MNKRSCYTSTYLLLIGFAVLTLSCAEKGEAGEESTSSIDCGKHGSAHEDHCHCDSGYLFNGTTCVKPDKITEECTEHTEHTDAGQETEEHHHEACLCPSEGQCPCDGKIEESGGKKYCVPNLHE